MNLESRLSLVDKTTTTVVTGKVTGVKGLILRATVPGLAYGDMVEIAMRDGTTLTAEVVGFDHHEALLLPFGDLQGIAPGAQVSLTGKPFSIHCGDALLGRVLDGMGVPIDGKGDCVGDTMQQWGVYRHAPDPFYRKPIDAVLSTGVRSLDAFTTLGKGQRVGLFAGSGVGKSTLLGQIAQGTQADVNVICLVGERGREMRDFIDNNLGVDGLKRSVVVCATSDAPSLVRLRSVYVATAIAEWFRDQQKADVLLMVDSLTRVARAQREVGLATGELPTSRGYPPSVWAILPQLVERAGQGESRDGAVAGSITGLYTVLVAGNDMDEPVADEVRGIVDGHIVLKRELGMRGRWPAIDVVSSVSRLMSTIASTQHQHQAQALRELMAYYEEHRDFITLGAYQKGNDSKLDNAIECMDVIERFLNQPCQEHTSFDAMVDLLMTLTHGNVETESLTNIR